MINKLRKNIPKEIQSLNRFLVWRYEKSPSSEKPLKVPYYVNGRKRYGVQGSPEDRASLSDFNTALKTLETGQYTGLGLAMLPESNLVGVDLDNCYNGFEPTPTASNFIHDTYFEVSPSGNGLRGFYTGSYPDKRCDVVQIFSGKGYLTLTGDPLNGHNKVSPLPDTVKQHLDRAFAKTPATSDRVDVLRNVASSDPVYQKLLSNHLVRGAEKNGAVYITCPFADDHTMDGGPKETVYYLPHTHGYATGNFHCLHAHCGSRTNRDFQRAIGYYGDMFEADVAESSRDFRLVNETDLKLTAPVWLVDGLLEADTLALVFGDPGCGKSFFAIDMACSIAAGIDFHGCQVKPAPVIYVAGEGFGGLKRRISAWKKHHHIESQLPLYISNMPTGLCDSAQAGLLSDAMEQVSKLVGEPSLIILDTVARNFGPGSENDTPDMTKFIAASDHLRTKYRSSVMLIHHTGHGDKSRARGNSALKGAVDAEYRMEMSEEKIITFKATKMKDSEFPAGLAFKLRTVPLGVVDERFQVVTSAVLEQTAYKEADMRPGPPKGSGKSYKKMIEVLDRLLADERCEIARMLGISESAAGVPSVPVGVWRDACMNEGVATRSFRRILKEQDGFAFRLESDAVLKI